MLKRKNNKRRLNPTREEESKKIWEDIEKERQKQKRLLQEMLDDAAQTVKGIIEPPGKKKTKQRIGRERPHEPPVKWKILPIPSKTATGVVGPGKLEERLIESGERRLTEEEHKKIWEEEKRIEEQKRIEAEKAKEKEELERIEAEEEFLRYYEEVVSPVFEMADKVNPEIMRRFSSILDDISNSIVAHSDTPHMFQEEIHHEIYNYLTYVNTFFMASGVDASNIHILSKSMEIHGKFDIGILVAIITNLTYTHEQLEEESEIGPGNGEERLELGKWIKILIEDTITEGENNPISIMNVLSVMMFNAISKFYRAADYTDEQIKDIVIDKMTKKMHGAYCRLMSEEQDYNTWVTRWEKMRRSLGR